MCDGGKGGQLSGRNLNTIQHSRVDDQFYNCSLAQEGAEGKGNMARKNPSHSSEDTDNCPKYGIEKISLFWCGVWAFLKPIEGGKIAPLLTFTHGDNGHNYKS